jgi:hypothetical protein
MEPLTQQIRGTLYQRDEKIALLLDNAGPTLFLRFAFIVQGTEKLIFPALALDDWGRERNTLALYRWVYEEGQRFPRAEVFGFTPSGQETQLFLRDLEIFFKYPCYVYPERKAPVSAGLRVEAIFAKAEEGTAETAEVEVPAQVNWPLRHAAVNWHSATGTALAAAGWRVSHPF